VSTGCHLPLGVSRPLTKPPRHHLRVVGYGLDMDHSLVSALPDWVKLLGVSLVPLCVSEFLHVFVFVTCKTIFSKYMWNLVNSKCICVLRLPISHLFVP
jgi:hypothetical protein